MTSWSPAHGKETPPRSASSSAVIRARSIGRRRQTLENLTHTLTGLFLSRAGLNRFTPRATWILLLAANAPDVDVVSAFGGSINMLHYHRHITHALIAIPVLPLLCVLSVRFVSRRPLNWAGAYVAALVAVASHVILDLTNTYGVRLLQLLRVAP